MWTVSMVVLTPCVCCMWGPAVSYVCVRVLLCTVHAHVIWAYYSSADIITVWWKFLYRTSQAKNGCLTFGEEIRINQHWRPFPTPPHFHHKMCPGYYSPTVCQPLGRVYTSDPHPHECPRLLLSPPDTQVVVCAILVNGAIVWPHPTSEENWSCCRVYIHQANQPDTGNTPWPQPEQLGM